VVHGHQQIEPLQADAKQFVADNRDYGLRQLLRRSIESLNDRFYEDSFVKPSLITTSRAPDEGRYGA
jgi:hypothetical protein